MKVSNKLAYAALITGSVVFTACGGPVQDDNKKSDEVTSPDQAETTDNQNLDIEPKFEMAARRNGRSIPVVGGQVQYQIDNPETRSDTLDSAIDEGGEDCADAEKCELLAENKNVLLALEEKYKDKDILAGGFATVNSEGGCYAAAIWELQHGKWPKLLETAGKQNGRCLPNQLSAGVAGLLARYKDKSGVQQVIYGVGGFISFNKIVCAGMKLSVSEKVGAFCFDGRAFSNDGPDAGHPVVSPETGKADAPKSLDNVNNGIRRPDAIAKRD